MRLFLIAIFLTVGTAGISQHEIGVNTSASRVKFRGDAIEFTGLTMRPDFTYRIGVFYQPTLKKNIKLQIGLNYTRYSGTLQTLDTLLFIGQPGVGLRPPSYLIDTEWRDSVYLKADLVEMPIIMNVLSNNNHWEFGSGGLLQFPLSATRRDEDGTLSVRDDFSTINIAVLFSAAYVVRIEKSFVRIKLAYSQGILNMTKNEQYTNSEFARIKSTSLNLGLNWSIDLAK